MEDYKNSHLALFVDYLYDNIRYGSSLKRSELKKLFQHFSLNENEQILAYEELQGLEIKILDEKPTFEQKFLELLFLVSKDKKISKIDLENWFIRESVKSEILKNRFRDTLRDQEIEIIEKADDQSKTIDDENFDFLNDIDFDDLDLEDLDDELSSEKFKQEMSRLANVPDKKYNLYYLQQLDSCKGNQENDVMTNLVKANKRLVWKIVKKYKHFSKPGCSEEDMYQLGMMGLIKAAERFDLSLGNQFSTYAIWWIRQSITRGIADLSLTIRVPVHMTERIRKMERIENEYFDQNFKNPNDTTLAELMGLSIEDIENCKIYKKTTGLTSLEVPIGDDESSKLGEFIPDDSLNPEDFVMIESRNEVIEESLDSILNWREKEVVIRRFGLNGHHTQTLEEIGELFGLTRERIRQIEQKALRKLSNERNIKRFEDFRYES